jgi:thioredoxin 1
VAGKLASVGKGNFKAEVLDSNVPVLVDFFAVWCGPCMMLAPTLEKLSDEMGGKIKVVKVNVDEEPELAKTYGIMSIPALFVFKNGEIAGQEVGVHPLDALKKWVSQAL